MSSPMKLTSSASFSPSIRISLRLKIHQAQAKNFCRVLDIRVAQVVESDVGQVVLLQQLVEGVAHIVGGVGVPVLPGEYVVVVYVVLAEVVAVVLFLLKQDLEQPYRIVCQGKAAEAGCVFRLVLLHDLRDPGHGVPYGQRLHRKVDAVPFQPQYPLRRRPYSAVT